MGKTLIVLGNGFDLDLGWKTSYSDFYKAKQQKLVFLNGMSYVHKMITEGHWYNLEGYLRECMREVPSEKVEELNYFWILCRNTIGDYLSQHNIYTTITDSCAYRLLSKISSSDIVSFNYTNPFDIIGLNNHDILYVHGCLKNRLTGAEIKLGVDSAVRSLNELTASEEKLKCIIKTEENHNIDNFLVLSKIADNIIIYGHSLGITDSDYFKPILKGIIENRVVNKTIYIVTYNESSLQCIKDNLLEYGISYSDLLLSNVNIKTVFTSRGKNDLDFCNMINNVEF